MFLLRFLRENFTLKVISLATSVMIWMYVTADRPNPSVTRSFNAEIVEVGTAPANEIVRLKTETVPVDISGPKSQVESIGENDVKAYVNISSARLGTTRLRIMRYEVPASAPDASPSQGSAFVNIEVVPRDSKHMPLVAYYSNEAPFGRRYGKPRLSPAFARVSGAADDVQRVAQLAVFVDTNGASVRADLPIKAQDKDGVLIDSVQVEPEMTHVELDLTEAPTTRAVIVSVPHRGKAAYPYEITDITVQPDQVTITGRPELLTRVTNVTTAEVPVDGITSDITRQVPLLLPPGITVKNGPTAVKVTVKVRDTSKPAPSP